MPVYAAGHVDALFVRVHPPVQRLIKHVVNSRPVRNQIIKRQNDEITVMPLFRGLYDRRGFFAYEKPVGGWSGY